MPATHEILVAARRAAAAGNRVEALQLCAQILEKEPRHIQALLYSAHLQAANCAFTAAAELYEKIGVISPNEVAPGEEAFLKAAAGQGKVFFWSGAQRFGRRDFAGALKDFRKLLQLAPGHTAGNYYAGLCSLYHKDMAEACGHFQKVLERVPHHVDAWFNLANALLLSGRYPQAAHCYQKALEYEAEFAEAHYNLGHLHFLCGEPGKAQKLLAAAEQRKPQWKGEGYSSGQIRLKVRHWKNNKPLEDYRDIPIFINCRDRLLPLQKLVDWLLEAGYTHLILLDNQSTYPPLLAYYKELEAAGAAKIIRLDKNLGHKALWESNILHTLNIETVFAYTDPDILPVEQCPADVLRVFYRILQKNPFIKKVGFGLKIDDIPEHFRLKSQIRQQEKQYWLHRLPAASAVAQYIAPVDTTFALYRHGNYYEICDEAVRTGFPYMARHFDWYLDSANLSEEQAYYYRHADRTVSTTKQALEKQQRP